MEGCKCENTKFGCCLDGIGEAKGENFEGCASIPENLQGKDIAYKYYYTDKNPTQIGTKL